MKAAQLVQLVILKDEKSKISSPTNQQCESLVPLGENGRNKQCEGQQNFEGSLGVLNCKLDYTTEKYLPSPQNIQAD